MTSASGRIDRTSARGREWQHGNAVPDWNPATGSTDAPIPDQWLDASDTSTLDKAGPLPITNGATVLEWRTKAGTARKYRLVGPNTAPTWDANVVGSLGGVKCNHQVLSADVLTGMRGLSARTFLCAFKQITNEVSATKGLGFVITEPHVSASADNPTNTLAASTGGFGGGTRRIQGNAIVNSATLLADNATVRPVADGQVFVVTGAINYAAGKQYYYANGVEAPQFAETIVSSGTTDATHDPFAMTVGGYLKEGPTLNIADGLCIAYIFEILDWFSLLSADQLVAPHDYLCNKWGGGLM
jgi:hypothetical protein